MQNQYKVLAVIPARGGSKGVKNKNIRLIGGKPLIYWSILEASKSKLISEFYVSTDSKDIQKISEAYKANILLRPSHLADDSTSMNETLQFLYKQLENLDKVFDIIVLLQPTAPFRSSEHIDLAIQKFIQSKNAKSLVSVYKVEDTHPARMYKLDNNECLIKVMNEPESYLRQDLDEMYHRNGAIYICTSKLLKEKGKLTCDNPLAFIMTKEDSINIDDEQDLEIANFLMEKKIKES